MKIPPKIHIATKKGLAPRDFLVFKWIFFRIFFCIFLSAINKTAGNFVWATFSISSDCNSYKIVLIEFIEIYLIFFCWLNLYLLSIKSVYEYLYHTIYRYAILYIPIDNTMYLCRHKFIFDKICNNCHITCIYQINIIYMHTGKNTYIMFIIHGYINIGIYLSKQNSLHYLNLKVSRQRIVYIISFLCVRSSI